MSKLTVQAMDSAAAMDEIVTKLGPDAVILSTTKLNGKVVMEAASGPLSNQMPLKDEQKFTDIFSEQMIKTPNSRLVRSKKLNNNTLANQTHESVSDQGLSSNSDVDSLRKQLIGLQKMMDGLFVTDIDGLNQNLSSNSRVILQQAGFSSQILNDFRNSYLGQSYNDGCNAFLNDLSSHLTHSNSEGLLTKKFIFVAGQTGTGRTTMVGKLTAKLKESFPHKEIITVEMVHDGQRPDNRLQDFCRLLNSQVYTVGIDAHNPDLNQIKQNEIMVVDLAVPIGHAAAKLKDITGELGAKNLEIVATIPASSSANMITVTMKELENVKTMVALTKLDECDISTAEFSSLASNDAKIGLFSASKLIMDAPIFASQNVLMQYLKENLDSIMKQHPTGGRTEI